MIITEREFFDRIILPTYTEKLIDYFTDIFDSVNNIILNPFGSFGSMFYYSQYHEAEEFVRFEFLDKMLRRYDGFLIPHALKLTSRVVQPHFFKHSVDNLPQCFKERCEFIFYLDNISKETDEFIKKMFFKDFICFFGLVDSYFEFEKVKEKKLIEELIGEEVF